MQKLTLKLDELHVESFTTANVSRSQGTVQAHSETTDPNESVGCPEDWTADCTWDCDGGGNTADACFSGGMNNCTTRFEN